MLDLRDTIIDVLREAQPIEGNGVAHLQGYHAIPTSILEILQAELNVHFCEPEAEQYELLERM